MEAVLITGKFEQAESADCGTNIFCGLGPVLFRSSSLVSGSDGANSSGPDGGATVDGELLGCPHVALDHPIVDVGDAEILGGH